MLVKPKALLAWSSGKDSAWALHVLRSAGRGRGRRAAHDAQRGLRSGRDARRADRAPARAGGRRRPAAQDGAAALAVQQRRVRGGDERGAGGARADGITHVAFGDLFLEDIRRYREERMAATGLTPLFPLWGEPTDALARRMIDGRPARAPHLRRSAELAPASRDASSTPRCSPSCRRRSIRAASAASSTRSPTRADVPRARSPIRAGEIVERDGFVFADLLPGRSRVTTAA